MCGICGVVSPSAIDETIVGVVEKMNHMLIHRGPNSEGFFASEHAVLAMRRLSIVDLAGGQQPIYNEKQDVVIVCNGEIYNHHELRQELKSMGHTFRSNSDVETIVHAYEEYGIACLKKLRGMFAFALFDIEKNKLFLARDKMGEKPLYLYRDQDRNLWFSSELRSLTQAFKKTPKLTPQAFNLFLTFQYIPEPISPFEGVEILPAGHYLELPINNPVEAIPVSYWSISDASENAFEPVKVTEDVLDSACKLMGSADVPVAVSLSGGIDSSLVAAITSKHYSGQLHAITIGYEGRPNSDERNFAHTLAKELGIGFTEVELKTAEVVQSFPELMSAMDTPIADIAAYGYYMVCKTSGNLGYPVLLSGIGGDEFFWGYEWVREAVSRNEELLKKSNVSLPWWRKLYRKTNEDSPEFFGIHPDLVNGDKWSRVIMPKHEREKLDDNYWLKQTELDSSVPMHQAVSNLLNRTWLRSNCLALADRMSMAHSVEIRLPLLDTELVERVSGMRNNGLVDWVKPHKWLLVEALKDILPKEILSRRKQGFTPPVNDWMMAIIKRFEHLLIDGVLVQDGLLDVEVFKKNASTFNLTFMYKLVLLECWVRLHVDGQNKENLLN